MLTRPLAAIHHHHVIQQPHRNHHHHHCNNKPQQPPPSRRHQIHWFSIVNSCVTVLLLTGFLATILLRVLKADFLRFSRGADGGPLDHEAGGGGAGAEEAEEAGWKYLHGDVFRFPPRASLFCAMVGVGTQVGGGRGGEGMGAWAAAD